MAYIYKITNDINDKIYIGKTEFSIEKRFAEHCRDAFRERNEKRPLYAAMRKYGIEHFHCELIEETNQPEEREKFWIEAFGSYRYGYNATRGGDGKAYADYDLINQLYDQNLTMREIQRITNYDLLTIRTALSRNGITRDLRLSRGHQVQRKRVAKIDKITNEILCVYPSIAEAEHGNGNTRHIADVCKGKRKTCKGFKWAYID